MVGVDGARTRAFYTRYDMHNEIIEDTFLYTGACKIIYTETDCCTATINSMVTVELQDCTPPITNY